MSPLPLLLALALHADPPLAQLPVNDVAVEKASVVQRSKELFGTKCTIAIWGAPKGEARNQAFDAAFDAFERTERLTSAKAGAPLAKINDAAGREAVTEPEELCALLRSALDGAKRTNGLFDPTATDELKDTCALVSWKKVELKPLPKPTADAACTVKLKTAGMKLSLGGIAKAWGIDHAAGELRSRGLKDFFVQAGGDLIVSGKSGNDPWKVGIRDPRGAADKSIASGEATDTALSTSGAYDHDVIDPHTCALSQASLSATIEAKTATEGSLLAKASYVLGAPKGLALAEKLGAQAVIVDPDGGVHVSKSLSERMQVLTP